MTNGRNPRGKRDTGRDPGGFVAIPWSVFDSAAYKDCSPTAKALLMEVARQYHRDDNGRMLLSRAYLATRGWYSAAVIQTAKAELIEAGLIYQTVRGMRPNKASWYAVTWRMLDKIPGYDAGAEFGFVRGSYRTIPRKEKRAEPKALAQWKAKKNASLIPPHGTASPPIVPPHGISKAPSVPPHGTISAVLATSSIPPHGNPLDVAISGVGVEGVGGVDLDVRIKGVKGRRNFSDTERIKACSLMNRPN